jgi:hypothetical protein
MSVNRLRLKAVTVVRRWKKAKPKQTQTQILQVGTGVGCSEPLFVACYVPLC